MNLRYIVGKVTLTRLLVSLVLANMVVVIPFAGWMALSPLFAPEYAQSKPSGASLLYYLFWGAVFSLSTTAFVGGPVIYQTGKKEAIRLKQFLSEVTKWFFVACAIGLVPVVFVVQSPMVFVLIFPAFFLFIIPLFLGATVYWCAANKEINAKKFSLLLFLFLLWSYECLQVSAFMAA